MKKQDWFKDEKSKFFKEEKKSLLSDKKIKIKKLRDDFTPERALKLAGGLAILGVGVHLASEIIGD